MSTRKTKSSSEPKVESVPIEKLVPYWRNPRKNDSAVAKVKESIERYGYQQPIIVDSEYTIIVGHTRYAALRLLEWETVPVIVANLPAKQAKEYRLVDNRTSEYAQWDYNDLLLELREISPETAAEFFPEINFNADFGDSAVEHITPEKVDDAAAAVATQFHEREPDSTIDITCPSCFETIKMRAGDLAGELKHG